MKIELSESMAIELRGLLNTAGKDLMEIGRRPHTGWAYHEWKSEELLRFGRIIDKKIKELRE